MAHETRTRGAEGPTVFLHIGTPKSGTTYLQTRMADNHQLAAEQGLLWPGPRWGVHVEAARELRRLKRGEQLDKAGPWMRLARTAQEWSGPRVLISMEWLAGCSPEQAGRAVAAFQPNRVEVIVTARDLLRSFVAQWQEMTKNCRPWGWPQFVQEVVEEKPGPAYDRFWNQQDIPRILTTWAAATDLAAVHLVTVPPAGSDPKLLWERFCSVLDLDGSDFKQPRRDNESLGVVSALVMQRVNVAALAQNAPFEEYQQVFHRGLADEMLAPRRSAEQPIAVTQEVDAWVRRRAEQLVEHTRELGVDVVGDLADLLPGKPLVGREPNEVADSELLDTCVDAFVALSFSQHRKLKELRAQNRRLRLELTEHATARPAFTPRVADQHAGSRRGLLGFAHGVGQRIRAAFTRQGSTPRPQLAVTSYSSAEPVRKHTQRVVGHGDELAPRTSEEAVGVWMYDAS